MNKIDLRDTRHKNLMHLIDDVFAGSQSEFAAAIKRNPTQVNHWVSRYRNPNGDTCRAVERSLGYQEGWLDNDHDTKQLEVANLFKTSLYTEGSNQALALVQPVQTAIGFEDAVRVLADAISASPARGSDVLIGALTSLAKDPDRLMHRQVLAAIISAPDQSSQQAA